MELQEIIRHGLILGCFGFLLTIFIIMKQDRKLNLALFYSFLWSTVSLGILNYICVHYGLWWFISEQSLSIAMPLDIYFIWIICWGVIPVYFFKGKHVLIVALIILWMDILCMPYFENLEIIELGSNWLIGEFAMITIVFLPAYLWAKFSLEAKQLAWRVRLQVITTGAYFNTCNSVFAFYLSTQSLSFRKQPNTKPAHFYNRLTFINRSKRLVSFRKRQSFSIRPHKTLGANWSVCLY